MWHSSSTLYTLYTQPLNNYKKTIGPAKEASKYADDDIFNSDSETEQDLNGTMSAAPAIPFITVSFSRSFVVNKLCPISGNINLKVLSHKIRSAWNWYGWVLPIGRLDATELIFRVEFYYGMEHNFVCSWRRPIFRSQITGFSLSALFYLLWNQLLGSVVDPRHLDADPDSIYHQDANPDADPDSDFYLMQMRIRTWIRFFTLMRIRIYILASK
jgi:hypothetical protein